MADKKKIAVIGSGYVGTTTAAILANCGYEVTAIDIDQQKVDTINAGKAPFFETGLDKLLASGVKLGTLRATTDYTELSNITIVFCCVGTPDNPDGSPNLSYIYDAAERAAEYLPRNAVYVQKSTVPVGTGTRLEKLFEKLGKQLVYVSNPEFLRESTAIKDTVNFDRVVVGSHNRVAAQKIIEIYRAIERKRQPIAKLAGIDIPPQHHGEYFMTGLNSAELIKVTANAFLALKISFANSIAKLADHTNADINEVMRAVGADQRIGQAFLNAGRGYGGGCFPKDVSGLISSATEHGVELTIMTAASDLNETMPGYIANKAQHRLKTLRGKKVAVLGLAFKAGTSDARKSPGVKLANILAKNGAEVSTYDPQATDEAKADLRKGVKTCDQLASCIKNCHAIFVATDWPEFVRMDIGKVAKSMKGKLFVDCINAFDKAKVEKAGLEYIGVGR